MKKIVLKKDTKIYIMAPANSFTGGPELLHQIAISIKKIFKVNPIMFYLPVKDHNPIHKQFKKYKLNFSNSIEDQSQNILIIPEHYMFLKYSQKFKNIKKILWWLSLDNYFGYKFKYDYNKFLRSIIKIPFNICNFFNKITKYQFGIFTIHDYLRLFYKNSKLNNFVEFQKINLHLSQSHYAYYYLKKYFQNIKYLSDFQRSVIIKNFKKKKLKRNIICYSNKSNDFLDYLKSNSNFKMIKLIGYNDKQLINIFRKTKIYMDFGYHPGKDRAPREALLFGNCVITNFKGSAKFYKDVTVPNNFKFEEKYKNLKKINKLIYLIFNDYKKNFYKMNKYKNKILNENNNEIKQVKIFLKKLKDKKL